MNKILLTEDEVLLVKNIMSSAEKSQNYYLKKFSFFLNQRQQVILEEKLKGSGFEGFLFYGGYADAERKILGLFPPYSDNSLESFPIASLDFTFREEDNLTHRDFLGALMSLGIKREMIGDIIVLKGKAVAFVYKTVATLVYELTRIGKIGVRVSEHNTLIELPQKSFSEISGTVSSLRLDCVVAFAVKISREKAHNLIKSTGVDLNYCKNFEPDSHISEGSVFSVRGFGKYKLFSVGATTKKDRIHITVHKFV